MYHKTNSKNNSKHSNHEYHNIEINEDNESYTAEEWVRWQRIVEKSSELPIAILMVCDCWLVRERKADKRYLASVEDLGVRIFFAKIDQIWRWGYFANGGGREVGVSYTDCRTMIFRIPTRKADCAGFRLSSKRPILCSCGQANLHICLAPGQNKELTS